MKKKKGMILAKNEKQFEKSRSSQIKAPNKEFSSSQDGRAFIRELWVLVRIFWFEKKIRLPLIFEIYCYFETEVNTADSGSLSFYWSLEV